MLLSVGDVSTKVCNVKFCNCLHWEAAGCAMKRTACVSLSLTVVFFSY